MRQRLTRLVAVVGGMSLLLSACGGGSSGLVGKSASQVLTMAMTAARGDSFRFVDKDGSGSQARLLVGQTGTVSADQSLSGSGVALEVRLTRGTVYVRGGATTLEGVLGLSATTATARSGQWLSVTAGDKGYRQIVATLKPAAELDGFVPQAPLALGAATTLHGFSVVPVSGTAPASAATGALQAKATMFVSNRAPYLPVGATLTGTDVHGRKQSEEVAFSDWGGQARPKAPTGAVSVASLTG